MSDASDTTRRRQQRMLYANKVLTETYYQKGYNNHIVLEGGVGNGAMTYEPYDKMRDGTTVTTTTEKAQDAFALYNSGGAAAQGRYLNFADTGTKASDETVTKEYGRGGIGGVPNTPASNTTVVNRGVGGTGTGATLNSFANGIAGGSGIVVLKWYTTP